MGTVTYKNQPAIHKTRGRIEKGGNLIPYRVNKILWPEAVNDYLEFMIMGKCLHVCCGRSPLGDVRLDIDTLNSPHIIGDGARLPIASRSFETVLCDPPYNSKLQWDHWLLEELARVSTRRIIFQQWYLPDDRRGRYKKDNSFKRVDTVIWPPVTYFGRVQVISVFDKDEEGIA